MLKQLSIYAENRKATLKNITGILEAEQINILGSVTNDSAEYGIVRMVVSDPVKAAKALEKEGYLCKLTEVTGVEVADEIGNLHHLLQALSESNINVDYVYLSFNRNTGMPILIFHTDDITEVEWCLTTKGFTVVQGDRF